MTLRYPLVLNGSNIQELQEGDSLAGSAETSDNLKVAGVDRLASVAATPNTIPARDSSADIYATVFRGVASSAQFADLAEKYEADAAYETATVVVFGGDKEITTTTTLADTRVAGVISEHPAYIMNSLSDGHPVALRGKVPVRVVGTVKKGDLLVTGELAGTAVVASGNYSPNAVFAKSLESKNTTDVGIVIAVVL
jgi:hypothetical protein